MLLLALVTAAATAQNHHYWIVLRNKDFSPSLQNNSQLFGITERALKRRAKSLSPDRLIDGLDYPISESVLSQIKQTGVKIRTVSRWLNAVSVEASPPQIQILQSLPMVSRLEPVMQLQRSQPLPSSVSPPSLAKSSSVQGLDYGPSATQLTNMKVVDLHAIGVNGTGVLIGMLDDGFNNYRTHTALKNIQVIATHDFIHNIEDVSIQPWELTTSPDQGNHGAGTLSAIGGFDNGHMIGAAFGASFILAKTEMDSSGNLVDFNSEEDTYVAALEWAERLGADITSSSLGYKEFEDSLFAPLPYYTTSDMNGRTTKVARAAVIAARKGVLVVTAMGNEGTMPMGLHKDSTLVSPADADSIISVGMTSSDGELAVNSGTGPTADGRIKPEVVVQGLGVYWANGTTTTGYLSANGTSCATPLVAGAAALILSAHPELTNMQVRDALMKTTVQRNDGTPETSVYPNNYYGYGFVNALSAALFAGPVFSNVPTVTARDSQLIVSTFIVSRTGIIKDSAFYYYRINGGTYNRVPLRTTATPNQYECTIPRFSDSISVNGYFSFNDSLGNNYSSQQAPKPPTTKPSLYTLFQNYPNPFNNETIISFDSPTEEEIEVTVFNILGQRMKKIFQGRTQIGITTLRWNGTNDFGTRAATGVYIVRMKTPTTVVSKKMLYLK
jgi:serine protease AprX